MAARGSGQAWLGGSAHAVPRRGLAMRVNRDIKAAMVRVVGLDGAELGVLSREDALAEARGEPLRAADTATTPHTVNCRLSIAAVKN